MWCLHETSRECSPRSTPDFLRSAEAILANWLLHSSSQLTRIKVPVCSNFHAQELYSLVVLIPWAQSWACTCSLALVQCSLAMSDAWQLGCNETSCGISWLWNEEEIQAVGFVQQLAQRDHCLQENLPRKWMPKLSFWCARGNPFEIVALPCCQYVKCAYVHSDVPVNTSAGCTLNAQQQDIMI